MDGDADQFEREVAARKAELAAEVRSIRLRRGARARRSAIRGSAVAATVAAAAAGALRLRRHAR